MSTGQLIDYHTLTGMIGWLYDEVVTAMHCCWYVRLIFGVYSWCDLAARLANYQGS
jgi:hypothetical protein